LTATSADDGCCTNGRVVAVVGLVGGLRGVELDTAEEVDGVVLVVEPDVGVGLSAELFKVSLLVQGDPLSRVARGRAGAGRYVAAPLANPGLATQEAWPGDRWRSNDPDAGSPAV
jgi:hypothetical protein